MTSAARYFFCIFISAAATMFAQSHPVGSEWPCNACSGGQVCYRENAEFTACRLPQGSHITPRGPNISAQIAQATARIQQNPRDANAWVARAVFYLTPAGPGAKPPLQNAEAAVRDLETALKIDPNNFYALHNYGHAAYLLDYDDFAIYEFTRAIAVNPRGSARSYLGRGWAYYQECKFDPAITNFRDAVRLDASLQSEIASPQKIQGKRQECAQIAAQQRYWAAHPHSQPSSTPNIGALYQRNEAVRRANELDAAGDHGNARIVREQNGLP